MFPVQNLANGWIRRLVNACLNAEVIPVVLVAQTVVVQVLPVRQGRFLFYLEAPVLVRHVREQLCMTLSDVPVVVVQLVFRVAELVRICRWA